MRFIGSMKVPMNEFYSMMHRSVTMSNIQAVTTVTDVQIAPANRCGFVAIVGRPNVGKSTLMNHLVGDKVSITSRKAQTTRLRVRGICTRAHEQFIFVDTPGFQTYHGGKMNEAMNKSVRQTLQDVDCVFFVLEALRFSEADQAIIALLPAKTPVIVVINKVDKMIDAYRLSVFKKEVKVALPKAIFHAVSAKHGHGLPELLDMTRAHLPESVFLYPVDMLTDKEAKFALAEIVREKVFRYLGEELPYAINVDIEKLSQTKDLTEVYAVILIDKETQKGIVIGKNGEKLKKISTEARLDMEKKLAAKVFLKVWVKVKSGWADDVRFLSEFGLD
jgi:GTP-binding protein Era